MYRCYSPLDALDGTAHVTATLASLTARPDLVLENVSAAAGHAVARGRYGYSNINVDRNWMSRDVVGIDLGAAVLALDNFLHNGRIRRIFHQLDGVQRGLDRLRARPRPDMPWVSEWRRAS